MRCHRCRLARTGPDGFESLTCPVIVVAAVVVVGTGVSWWRVELLAAFVNLVCGSQITHPHCHLEYLKFEILQIVPFLTSLLELFLPIQEAPPNREARAVNLLSAGVRGLANSWQSFQRRVYRPIIYDGDMLTYMKRPHVVFVCMRGWLDDWMYARIYVYVCMWRGSLSTPER